MVEVIQKKKVEVIQAKAKNTELKRGTPKKKKVCAYCRVSTEHEEQLTSYEAQVKHYTQSIKNNPDYKLINIYADKGITGTSTKDRDQFNQMIEDCKDGKIDLIITKSISRFARNILDCITYTRLLKEIDVEVYFEKENISTMDSTGEFVLTILGGLAQEESRSISKNSTWGIRHSFQNGNVRVNHNRFLGYTKDEEGKLIIVPEEAEIIKLIFRLYLEGNGYVRIKNILEEKNLKTGTGGEKWYPSTVSKILKNEKYMGDALLQKTFTVDFINKKRKNNKGDVNQYYVEDSHEGIISKETFEKVQEEMIKRDNKLRDISHTSRKRRSTYKYALSEIMHCYHCGDKYRRTVWTEHDGSKKPLWRCNERITNGTRNCNQSPTLNEERLQKAIITMLNSLKSDKTYIQQITEDNINQILLKGGDADRVAIETEIMEVKDILNKLLEQQLEGEGTTATEKEIKDNNTKLNKLIDKKENTIKAKEDYKNLNESMKRIKLQIGEEKDLLINYDDDVVRRFIEKIEVIDESNITVVFKTGLELKLDHKK